MKIPLSEPLLNGREWRYVKECLDTGWVSSAGKYVSRFEEDVCRLTGAKYGIAVVSGTAALQTALEIVGVRAGDEVIVPTVTFIAPVNCLRYLKAEPVFMDCDEYYNMDVDKTLDFLKEETIVKEGACVNKRTKRKIRAIVPVHVFGHAVNLAPLMEICRQKNIAVVEDATESLGTYYKNGKLSLRHTGTVGDMGCFSFNGNKIVTTGGGGMIVSNDKKLAERARYLTTQAKDDARRYIHNEVGYNFRLSNVHAAIGVAQLQSLKKIIATKKKNYQIYQKQINTIDGLRLADVPGYAENNYWLYALQIDPKRYGKKRDALLKIFAKNNIEARPLWYLNHWQKPYQHCQTYKIERAVSMWERTLNIPSSAGLKGEEIVKIIQLLK